MKSVDHRSTRASRSWWSRWVHDPAWTPVDKILVSLGLVFFFGSMLGFAILNRWF